MKKDLVGFMYKLMCIYRGFCIFVGCYIGYFGSLGMFVGWGSIVWGRCIF